MMAMYSSTAIVWLLPLVLYTTDATVDVIFTSNTDVIQAPITDLLKMRCSVEDVVDKDNHHPTTTTVSLSTGSSLVGRSVELAASGDVTAVPYEDNKHGPQLNNGQLEMNLNQQKKVQQEKVQQQKVQQQKDQLIQDQLSSDAQQEDLQERETRDVTAARSTADPVRHVTTITVSRDGVPVATVSTYTPAHAESRDDDVTGRVHVTGDVSGVTTTTTKGGQLGYLDLTWTFPSRSQVGRYACDVTGITEAGHSVSFRKSLEIEEAAVSLDDLVGEIRGLKDALSQQNVTNNVQQETIDQQQTRIESLGREVMESRHVESGSLHCAGSSSTWPPAPGGVTQTHHHGYGYFNHQKIVTANFKKGYSNPPVVFLSANYLYVRQDQSVHVATQLVSVDNQGFVIKCGSGRDGYLVDDMEINWISVHV